MERIIAIVNNPVFQFIGMSCSIVGALIGILAIIPKTRKTFFSFEQKISIGQQEIDGSGNAQAGGNITNEGDTFSSMTRKSKTDVGNQTIVGNNNKQAGGDIKG